METIVTTINDWKIEHSRSYTDDDLINAYLKGKEEGMNIERKIMIEKLQHNLTTATVEGSKFFNYINNEKIGCKMCFLKIENPLSFEIIYIIDSKDYTEKSLNKIYSSSREKKTEINNETFYLNFSFIPNSDSLNESRLTADGYILKYLKND